MLYFLINMANLIKILFMSAQLIFIANHAMGINLADRNEFLKDTRCDDGDIYLNRISAYKNYENSGVNLGCFGEIQRNTKKSLWEKITIGLEAEKRLFKYLNAGQSIQYISGEIMDFMTFSPGNQSIETTLKLNSIIPLSESLFKKRLALRIWDEYSYNLEKGSAGLNETGIEFNCAFKENARLGFGWRHSDRIHNFDTDYCSASIYLEF